MHDDDTKHRILEVIIGSPNCEPEEVVRQCEGLTWNQVFLVIEIIDADWYTTNYPADSSILGRSAEKWR